MSEQCAPMVVPGAFVEILARHHGPEGPGWGAELPGLAERFLEAWGLRAEGPVWHGMAALVLPVRSRDGEPAVLKLQRPTEDTVGEPVGLRVWDGRGTVRLLRHDPPTGTMLLERLDAGRSLSAVPDAEEATGILAELLARLVAVPAPPGIRTLADIGAAMLAEAPQARTTLPPDDRRLLDACAGALREVLPEPGDRLLHWDLHFDNVLAGEREPWLAIDPQPLAGDPGFDLLPALDNRWDDITATGDVPKAVRRRFDLMTGTLGLDRDRATAWTLARVLQNTLWDIADGEPTMSPIQKAIAQTLLPTPIW